MGSRSLAAATLVIVLTGASAAVAGSSLGNVTSRSGATTATLTYRHDAKNQVVPYSDLRLTIDRDGKTLYDAGVENPACGRICWPDDDRALWVTDVEGDGEPDVLLNLYTGGAHCCNLTEVFSYDAAHNDYSSLLHVWGDPDYTLDHLDHSKMLDWLTYDDRFAYEFAAYAFSGLPFEILRLENGRFVNVTRDYPAFAAVDAKRQWKYYLENRGGGTGLGFLAAWAADEYNLGKEASVTSTLDALEHAHELRSNLNLWPSGAKFVVSLESFLLKTGYAG